MTRAISNRPTSAGRFQLEERLGEGGMASVWRAYDTAAGKPIAVKRLTAPANTRLHALFEREYHILAGLRHPHIVEVYDFGTDERGPYYTMEFLEGADLVALAPMPWDEVCRCLREIASALGVLHARRMLHRDVSPRNVWRLPDGRYKLIDFGALAAFGTPRDLVGTPPCVPPEALHGQPLDQRVDLYALGATGYWALTGTHAYPARRLSELASMWHETAVPPSSWVERVDNDLPSVPDELDRLIGELLSHNAMARPVNAAEIMDRLDALTGREREDHVDIVEGCLGSKAFVGREAEQRRIHRRLQRASKGKGSSMLVEGAAGIGRTRLLQQVAVDARLSAAVVLQAEAGIHESEHGVAEALALKLLDALPERAHAAAEPHAGMLAHLSERLRERLEVASLEAVPRAAGEMRMRLQVALRDWFLAVAEQQLLVLLVDDAQSLDDASAAWLAALAHEAREHKLCLLTTLRTEAGEPSAAGHEPSASLQALQKASRHVQLEPLTPDEMLELLRSVFGDAPHIQRLAERLHRVTRGNPEHCMALASHLVHRDIIGYVDGTWVLPQDLPADELPASRHAATAARLERLPEHARRLGRALGIHGGMVSLEMCLALAEAENHEVFSALDALVGEGVLVGQSDGYRFATEELRTTFLEELEPASERQAHSRLGEALLADGHADTVERIKAGVHIMLGGHTERGAAIVAKAGIQLVVMELENAGPAIGALERALALFRQAGRSSYELISVLAPLATSSYYVDRRLLPYSTQLMEHLQEVLGLDRARRLQPFLGRKLGLVVALGGAAWRFKRLSSNPLVPSFREAMFMLLNGASTATGCCAISVDPKGAEGFARTLEPLRALGEDHIASLVHEFCLCLAATVQDRPEATRLRWHRLLERIEGGEPVKDMPEHVRLLYLGGALYACGVLESWRDGPGALEFAERLDALNLKLYEMSADQIRMVYYAHQGDAELFKRYRDRVEMHAIQRGTAWQVELWAPGAEIQVHARTHDAMSMKRCMEQMQRSSDDVPALRRYGRMAQMAYLAQRGKYREALEVHEALGEEEPLAVVGWSRSQAMLARIYNGLGEHARAREICQRVLDMLSPEDLSFTATNLGLLIERALADAQLGNGADAARELDAWIDEHRPNRGPLTLGALHEARARVALHDADEASFEAHKTEMERWYLPTEIPSLVSRCAQLAHSGKQVFAQANGKVASGWSAKKLDPLTLVHSRLGSLRSDLETLAQCSLDLLAEEAGVAEAYLLVDQGRGVHLAAQVGDNALPRDAFEWAVSRIDEAREDDQTTDAGDTEAREIGSRMPIRWDAYRMGLLSAPSASGEVVLGAVLIASGDADTDRTMRATRVDTLRAIAVYLLDAMSAQSETRHMRPMPEAK